MKKRQIKILLIEDNPGDVRLIKEMISEATDIIPKIECVNRLDAGIERLAEGGIDILLLDLGLPDSQGLDTFIKADNQTKDVSIVVLTGLDDEELGLAAVQKGAQDYLVKGQVYGNILVRALRYAIEHKRAEKKLRESEERYKEIVEKAGIAIVVDDEEGNIVYANKKAADLYGYSLEGIKKQSIKSLVHPDDFERVMKYHEARIQGKKVPSSYVFKGVKKDGSVRHLEINAVPNRKGRSTLGTRLYIKDITERKQAEDALRKSEEKYRALVENATDFIYMIDKNNKVLSINKAAANLFRRKPKEIRGKSILDLFPRDISTRFSKNLKKVYETGSPSLHESKMVVGKRELWISSSLSPVKDHEGKVAATMGVTRDITERKLAEEQIKASLKEKEVLLKEIHHRVKNNMQIISSLIKLQSQYVMDEKALETFKSTQNRVKSMALVHDSIYKSKDLARVDVADYVQDLAGYLFSIYGIDPKTIKLNVNIKDLFLDINTAIPSGLIINELVSNSMKHAFPKGKKGEIKVAMHPLKGKEVELIVSDNGIGIPKDVDFRNTESLGLHIVSLLAEDQLHGEIVLNRDNGTEFQIKIKRIKS